MINIILVLDTHMLYRIVIISCRFTYKKLRYIYLLVHSEQLTNSYKIQNNSHMNSVENFDRFGFSITVEGSRI